MRWDELFEDLEAQFAAQAALAQDDLAAEIGIAERARLRLFERVRRGAGVRVGLASGGVHEGLVSDVGNGWLLVAMRPRDVLVTAAGVEWLEGAGRADPDRDRVVRQIGLGHLVRGLAEREVDVVVGTRTFDVAGTVRVVGADHIDIADERGRVVSIPWDAIVSVLL